MTDLDRRDVLRGVAGLSTAPFLVASTAGQVDAPDGPSGVHAAYGRDPASTLRVGWSGAPAVDAHLAVGEPGEAKTTVRASARPVPGREAVAYAATVTGLSPDTTYEYEAVLDGRRTGPFRVSTAPDATDGFTVTAVGDHGVADPENPFQRPDSDDPQRVMETAAALETDLQVVPGDVSYANGHPSTWELYFETFEDFYAETPFMTVPGNHEAEPGTGLLQYDRRLDDLMPVADDIGVADLQHEPRWYHLDYDDTRFVGLSTTTDACGDVGRGEEYVPIYDPRCEAGGLTYGEAQERYLRAALEEATADDDLKWTVVYFHGPMWTDSPDHAPRRDLRARWGPLFDAYGVDLVLSGDNHVYERTKPISARPGRDDYGPADAWEWETKYGTTFVTNGTGGTSHYGFASETPSGYIATRSNEYFGVTRLAVDGERIRVEYVTTETGADGSPVVADAFEIRKSGQRTERGVRRPMQLPASGGGDAGSLVVEGTRTDDGSVFTAGDVNHVRLSFEANHPVRVRDKIPESWTVVAGGRATADAPGDAQWVYLDREVAESGESGYVVETPGDPDGTGRYTLGPFQAQSPRFGDWMDVPGTASEETVVGVDGSTGAD
jgi:hypothetical protein